MPGGHLLLGGSLLLLALGPRVVLGVSLSQGQGRTAAARGDDSQMNVKHHPSCQTACKFCEMSNPGASCSYGSCNDGSGKFCWCLQDQECSSGYQHCDTCKGPYDIFLPAASRAASWSGLAMRRDDDQELDKALVAQIA